MSFHHVSSHQDDRKKKYIINLHKHLNIRVDEIATKNLLKSIETYILNTPIAIYLLNIYIPNKYLVDIRSHCSEIDTNKCIINKYKWTANAIDDNRMECIEEDNR